MAPATNFRSEAEPTLRGLQSAVATAIAAVAPSGTNALALSRVMSIDKTLAWRMTRFAAEQDPFAASAHLPGEVAIRIFARASRERGLPAQDADHLDHAIRAFGELRRRHAGSRSQFQALLADCRSDGEADERSAQFRRDAFMANAALWGICARVRLMSVIRVPHDVDGAGVGDVVLIHGYFGLKRLRGDVSWPLGHGAVGNGRSVQTGTREETAPIVTAFSSPSVHEARLVRDEDGHWIDLPEGQVGDAASVDLVTAERLTFADGAHTALLRMDVPCEWGIVEMIDFPGEAAPQAPRTSLEPLFAGHAPRGDRAPKGRRMPLPERPEPIQLSAALPEVPFHGELVRHLAPWLGSAHGQAAGWRLRVRHPPAPSGLCMTPDQDAR
jgi:hypothetical protein